MSATGQISQQKPVELVAKEYRLPNIVLYRKDFEAIVSKLRSLVATPTDVVITANIDGQDVTQFANIFLARNDLPAFVRDIKLNVTNAAQPFQKSILLILSSKENSRFFIQSDDSVWTNGTFASLQGIMARYTSGLAVFFQKYGLNLNGIIFMAALIMLPSLQMGQRAIFLFAVIVFLMIFKKAHDAINRPKIYLDNSVRQTLSREYPSIISALIAGALTAAAAYLFQALSSGKVTSTVLNLLNLH